MRVTKATGFWLQFYDICGRSAQQESASFLKKRSKKLLLNGPEAVATTGPNGKSFLVLFFKKEHSCLLSFA
jgi:hypothetical protein